MTDLEKKLLRDPLKPGARQVACRFPLESFEPIDELVDPKGEMGLESVWVYDLDAQKARATADSGRASV